MPDELRFVGAAALAITTAAAMTPAAIALARKTNFHDQPVGYKQHSAPTPYLGGMAVMCAFLAATLAFGDGLSRFAPILLGVVVLWAVGTVDDRTPLRPLHRVVVEAAAAAALWAAGLGWSVFDADMLNLALTTAWVVGLVNAFNLIDNIDGAAATVASVSTGGVALIALSAGDPLLAACAIALSAACLGFLPFNVLGRARIFLGDGGSMPIGFVAAAVTMALPGSSVAGLPTVLAASLLVGMPILDTTLVMVSRRRRGIPLLTGGRDHLTHRLLARLGTTQSVALTLALGQAALGGLAALVMQLGPRQAAMVGALIAALWAATLIVLETPRWAPASSESSV